MKSEQLAAGAPFPANPVACLGGGKVAPAAGSGWRLLVNHRGQQCPLCNPCLGTLV